MATRFVHKLIRFDSHEHRHIVSACKIRDTRCAALRDDAAIAENCGRAEDDEICARYFRGERVEAAVYALNAALGERFEQVCA